MGLFVVTIPEVLVEALIPLAPEAPAFQVKVLPLKIVATRTWP